MCPLPRAVTGLVVLAALLVSALANEGFDSRPGIIQELRTALADLAGEGRTYLGRMTGEQTVLSVQKAFSQVLGVVAGAAASGLNLLIQSVSQLLQAAGIPAPHTITRVTPEGLVYVGQWVLVALISYWLVSLAFAAIACALRRTLWLLKASLALACFGVILIDHSVGTEVMAVRLAVLVCVCVLLGVGPSSSSNMADKTAQLEKQVAFLQRRLGEIERRRKTE